MKLTTHGKYYYLEGWDFNNQCGRAPAHGQETDWWDYQVETKRWRTGSPWAANEYIQYADDRTSKKITKEIKGLTEMDNIINRVGSSISLSFGRNRRR